MRSFNWILPRQLAGAGKPGLLGTLEDDLSWLRAVGIRHIVSLTEDRLELPADCELNLIHFPIPDMGSPTPRSAVGLCETVVEKLGREEPVLFHCRAGLGRTGTMLACILVSQGHGPEAAIERVRFVSSYYIQSQNQERFIGYYAEFLGDLQRSGELPAGFVPPQPTQ